MEWIADPTALLGLGTLILLEIVLGIDNLIFIAILVDKLPLAQRNRARIIGLSLALLMRIAMLAGISWLQTLTAPVFTVLSSSLSVRDWGVRIVTLADGDVTNVLVAIKGLLGSIFLDDLAQKTERGQVGRVKAGRIRWPLLWL
jgi:predicted tellurium resistance membrane protein TerC